MKIFKRLGWSADVFLAAIKKFDRHLSLQAEHLGEDGFFCREVWVLTWLQCIHMVTVHYARIYWTTAWRRD